MYTFSAMATMEHMCPILHLEGHYLAEFTFNPN